MALGSTSMHIRHISFPTTSAGVTGGSAFLMECLLVPVDGSVLRLLVASLRPAYQGLISDDCIAFCTKCRPYPSAVSIIGGSKSCRTHVTLSPKSMPPRRHGTHGLCFWSLLAISVLLTGQWLLMCGGAGKGRGGEKRIWGLGSRSHNQRPVEPVAPIEDDTLTD